MKNLRDILDNLEKDLELVIKVNYHPESHNLLNILLTEDVPELIKFVRKVNEVFEKELPSGTGDTYHGFKTCFNTIKREIYE